MAPHDDELRKQHSAQTGIPDVSRRDFLKTVGATGITTAVAGGAVTSAEQARSPQAPAAASVGLPDSAGYVNIRREVAENLTKRGIVGYAEPPAGAARRVHLLHGEQ